jgi:diguanylate cyclase (GGDEF)-like protein
MNHPIQVLPFDCSWVDFLDSACLVLIDGIVCARNTEAEQLLGETGHVGALFATAFGMSDQGRLAKRLNGLAASASTDLELALGDYRTLDVRVRRTRHSIGQVFDVVTLRDVTSENAGQLTVLYSSSRHRAVLDGLREGVVIFDEHGTVVEANRAASFIFANIGFANVVGMLHTELLNTASVGGRILEAAELPTSSAILRNEASSDLVLRIDGVHGPRWISISCRPIDLVVGPQGAALSIQDVTAYTMAESDLAFLAHHDPLTGLMNRTRLRIELELALARAVVEPVSVLMIDLDGFKNVNDSQGHSAGDQVLIEVAHRLQKATRPSDRVARLGGDEFAVLLGPQTDAVAMAKRLIEAISEPIVVGDMKETVGASIGVSSALFGEATVDQVLAYADTAMYTAKKGGKGAAAVFKPQMLEEVLRRTELRAALDRAIGGNEFTLVFQPNIRLADRTIVGFEALLRWSSRNGEILAPSEFIPVAEDTGQIVAIGRWVLEEAIDQLATWQKEFDRPDLSMAVNVSARQMIDGSFVSDVARVLAITGVKPWTVVLELTETMLINDPRVVADTLIQLRKLGVLIAIDDYGSGNASISYLRNFAVDVLKVDRSLVLALDEDPKAGQAMVRSITDLASSLQLTTIAEGIEREDQLEMLTSLGCDEGQGFHLAIPLTADQAYEFLEGVPEYLTAQPRLATSE